MRQINSFWIILTAALPLCPIDACAEVPKYKLDLILKANELGGDGVGGLNNLGQVVGARDVNGSQTAFVYSNGKFEYLKELGNSSSANDINDQGEIVGQARGPSGQYAFLYKNGSVTNLSSSLNPSERFPAALAINNSGHVIGTGSSGGFYYDGSTSYHLRPDGLPTGAGVQMVDINDRNVVLGYTYGNSPSDYVSFTYDDGKLTTIPNSDNQLNPAAINGAGNIVGASNIASVRFTPSLYSNGEIQSLGTLGGVGDEGNGGSAFDINEANSIVGTSFTTDLALAAFLYQDGEMHNVNSLLMPSAANRWHLQFGLRINDVGQILAAGHRIGASEASAHYFLLSPVPEPQTYFFMLAGLTLVVVTAKRKRSLAMRQI